jgi:hypothetical protein
MGEFEVGQFAQRLVEHYLSTLAGWTLLRLPAGEAALQRLERENTGPAVVPISDVGRQNGTMIWYSVSHYLRRARDDPDFQVVHARLGLEMAIVSLHASIQSEGGFDHGPDLEFLRHLRNAVAHGNRFELRNGEPRRDAYSENYSIPPQRFEVTKHAHERPALFEFLGPGDVCDLLNSIGSRLIVIGNEAGETL